MPQASHWKAKWALTLATTDAAAGRINNWRGSMTIVTALLGFSVLCYLFGTLYGPRAPDYREELKARPLDEEVCRSSSPSSCATSMR